MKIGRWVAGLICLCGIVLFVYSVPMFYVELRDHCVGFASCSAFYDTAPTPEWLESHGLTASAFAFAYTALYTLFGLVYISVGLLIFRYKSKEFVGSVASVALVTQGYMFNSLSQFLLQAHPSVTLLVKILEVLSYSAFMTLYYVFPNGRFAPRWTKYALIVLLLPGIGRSLLPGTPFDLQAVGHNLYIIWTMTWMVSLLTVQIHRYRKVLDPIEKQQAKWAFYGMFGGIAFLIGVTLVFVFKPDDLNRNPLFLYGMETLLDFGMMLIPFTLAIALLKRRLWDIDALVNRTLVYVALSLFVIAVYIVGVWYVGTVFRSASNLISSLIATGIIAILFSPLKEFLQRKVNRLIYGDNEDPLTVLGTLGCQLENPLSPHEALKVVVHTVKDALKLPYAGLSIVRDGGGDSMIVAEEGEPASEPLRLPLVHRGEKLGELLCAPRSAGESFTVSDRRFLDMLVRQAGAVVQSATASLDLIRAAEDLRESRERLVLAREEERRRLRGNLHDDLAPRLAALAFTASAAETLLESDPAKTKAILAELQTVIRSSVADIRRLVHDLRPPSLDELGLIDAIRERIHDITRPMARPDGQAGGGPTEFRLFAPETLPELPAAVEVAAFRIVTEAMVNVIRHSGARRCEVSIAYILEPEAALTLEIADDGVGIGVGGGSRRAGGLGPGGIGLQSMRERAEELGGYFRVENVEPAGARVTARLPLTAGHDNGERSESA
ncbi:sensor histidine kinase [Cohnella candidum]|uniref:histidine kinase n=1 Tax=Cohnella candidum TaxID=2674991 RepID=A0A3G3K220_9BACL|nr:histidine kinase [Cohnella candidum]AYQ74518.1 sensor histidine kinase [Cohnella candidum]